MIVSTRSQNREVRDLFSGTDRIPRAWDTGAWTWSGSPVTSETASGLPAVGMAVRLIAESIAGLPLKVFRSEAGETVPVEDSMQWSVLHDRPSPDCTAFDLWSYVASCLQYHGNAYLFKLQSQGQVVGLWPLNPCRVDVKQSDDGLTYEYTPKTGAKYVYTTRQLIHVRGLILSDPRLGVSPIEMHANALGSAQALEEFEGRFWRSDATPGGILSVEGNLTRQSREEIRESWNAKHQGKQRSHQIAVVDGGAKYEPVALPLKDAEFIQSKRFGIEDVARIFKVPPSLLLGGGSDTSPEHENLRFLQYGLQPWISRIEQALHADDQLFPDKTLKPKWVVDALLRADTATRYAAYVQARQAGWQSANEIRALEGYPPVEGGDQVQATPVGGAPNPEQTD